MHRALLPGHHCLCLHQHPPAWARIERITDDAAQQQQPDISGDLIVWQDQRQGTIWDIYACDLRTVPCTEVRITFDEIAHQHSPAVDGNSIVWADERNGNSDIYFCEYDFSAGACGPEQRVETDQELQAAPVISGRRIVWVDRRGIPSDFDLWYWEIDNPMGSPPAPLPIAAPPGTNQTQPAIDGNLVVWQDSRSGDTDIYAFDFNTGLTGRITSNALRQEFPDVSGDTVIWADLRDGNQEVYYCLYDTAARSCQGPVQRLTDDPAQDEYPVIDGNNVVFISDRHNTGRSRLFHNAIPSPTTHLLKLLEPCCVLPVVRPAISGNRVVVEEQGDITLNEGLETQAPQLIAENISQDAETQSHSDIFGDYVVWGEYAASIFDSSIRLYHIPQNTEHDFAPLSEYPGLKGGAVISHNRIAWVHDRQLYLYDILDDSHELIWEPVDVTTTIRHVRISDAAIVWQVEDENDTVSLMAYDFTKRDVSVFKVLGDTFGVDELEIDGDRVVWHDTWRSRNIFLYDLSTEIETQITNSRNIKIDLDISGDYIAWAEDRDSSTRDFNIYLYDIRTGQDTRLLPDMDRVYQLAIEGNRIVFRNTWNNGNTGLYMYKIANAELTCLTSHYCEEYRPHISGGRVTFETQRPFSAPPCDEDVFLLSTDNTCQTCGVTDACKPLSVETQLTKTPNTHMSGDVSETHAVWVTTIDGEDHVVLHDLAEAVGKNTMISDTKIAVPRAHPHVDGDYALWEEPDTEHDLVLYQRSAKQRRLFPARPAMERRYGAAIAGDYVAWFLAYKRVGQPAMAIQTLRLSDLPPDTPAIPEALIRTHKLFPPEWPHADRALQLATTGVAVWEAPHEAPSRILRIDVNTGRVTEVDPDRNAGPRAYPNIWEHLVVWQEGYSNQLKLHDLATRKTRTIPDAVAVVRRPAVHGNLVIWVEKQEPNPDVELKVYNRETGITGTLQYFLEFPPPQSNPVLHGRNVVFTHDKARAVMKDGTDVFWHQIAEVCQP